MCSRFRLAVVTVAEEDATDALTAADFFGDPEEELEVASVTAVYYAF